MRGLPIAGTGHHRAKIFSELFTVRSSVLPPFKRTIDTGKLESIQSPSIGGQVLNLFQKHYYNVRASSGVIFTNLIAFA